MNHQQASDLLIDLVDGALGAAERGAVESHLAECSECTAWVATYRRLAAALPGSAAAERPAPSHPSADTVSRLALAPSSLGELPRARAERHVKSCLACRREVELVQAAAREAVAAEDTGLRKVQSLGAWRAKRSARKPWLLPVAVAATLLLVVGALAIGRGTGLPAEVQLSGATLTGATVVQVENDILVEATEVRPGADLALITGGTVVFGEGFAIDADGTLSVRHEAGRLDQMEDSDKV